MFWGIVLENGKRYTQVVDDGFHISMAALEPQLDKKNSNDGPVSVMMEREKTEFLLCTLSNEKCLQQPLDLNFAEGEAVTLFLNGEGIVHLSGYVVEAEAEEQDFYTDEDEESESEVEESDLKSFIEKRDQATKRKSPATKQIQNAAKKQKVDSSDEDDDDDDDDDIENIDDSMDDDDDEDEPEAVDIDSDDDCCDKSFADKKKKGASKSQSFAAQVNNKKSPSPAKKVTIAVPQKQQAVPKTPVRAEKPDKGNKNAKGAQTPATNGEKSPNDSLTTSSKKKRRHRKKNEESPAVGSPQANSGKTPSKPQDNVQKTPGKAQNNVQKTPGKAQNNVQKTPGKAQNNAEKTPSKAQKKLPSGVIVEDVQVGHGPEAKPGKMIHVHYVGTLKNNKEFDSCKKGEKPFNFRLGSGEVIKGWDSGIQGMKVGGTRKIVVPAHQGYGNKGIGSIPPNSTLNFEVQLVSVS